MSHAPVAIQSDGTLRIRQELPIGSKGVGGDTCMTVCPWSGNTWHEPGSPETWSSARQIEQSEWGQSSGADDETS